MAINDKKIFFFDGVCGLCNHSVNWIIRYTDPESIFVSPLQGKTAKEILPQQYLHEPFESSILWEQGRLYTKSDVYFKVISDFPWFIKWTLIFKILPKFVLDSVYDWVSKHRYKIFGKKETCRLPAPQERERFLD